MKKNYSLMVLIALFAIANVSFAEQTVKLRVQVPDTTMVVYATGGFNNWSTSATPMTKVRDSLIFETDITVPDRVEDDYNFKFLAGPDWMFEQADPAADFTYGAVGFTGAVVNAFQRYYTPGIPPGDVKVNVMVPKTTVYCYITGNFANWEQPQKEMTFVTEDEDGKYYTYTVPNVDAQLLQFKFASGPSWAYEQTQSTNFYYLDNGGANNEVNVVCTGFKAIYDPVNVGDITVNITSYPVGTDSIYLMGSFGSGWGLDNAIPAVKNEDGTFTAVIQNVADVEFKCWNRKDWDYEECQADGSNLPENRKAKFKDTSVVNITVARWKKMVAGVESIKLDNAMTIVDQKITVSGVQSAVNIYNINGQLLQSFKGKGDFSSRVLPLGVYILQVDNERVKVIVE